MWCKFTPAFQVFSGHVYNRNGYHLGKNNVEQHIL